MYLFKKRKIVIVFFVSMFCNCQSFADTDALGALNTAISNVRLNCSGISAQMQEIKKMAGIGTVVNAVGTAAGVGGVVSGVIKSKKDENTLIKMADKYDVDSMIEKLKNKEASPENQKLLTQNRTLSQNFEKSLDKLKSSNVNTDDKNLSDLEQRSKTLKDDIDKSQRQSTLAGNIRTGLFATDTVTNVAGAVVSAKTIANDSLIEKIHICNESVDALRTAQSRAMTENPDQNKELLEKSQNIINKCGEYKYVDMSKLNKLGKGALITNSVGAATGTVATVTSVAGNSKKIANMDMRNEADTKSAANNVKMNLASNIIGGVTTAASATGAVLNASQIKEVKKLVEISQECEGVL